MITNNLFHELKERNSENIAKRGMMLSMQGKIDFLRDLKVELDIRHGESSYDIMLIARFTSMKDLDAYLVHAGHVKVAKYIASVLESAAAVCCES